MCSRFGSPHPIRSRRLALGPGATYRLRCKNAKNPSQATPGAIAVPASLPGQAPNERLTSQNLQELYRGASKQTSI
jgi:hypothetical protein